MNWPPRAISEVSVAYESSWHCCSLAQELIQPATLDLVRKLNHSRMPEIFSASVKEFTFMLRVSVFVAVFPLFAQCLAFFAWGQGRPVHHHASPQPSAVSGSPS